MLSLCVEDYFLKGLEISWWRMCRAVPGRGIYLGGCWSVERQGTIHRHAPGAGRLLASLPPTQRTIVSTVATRDQPRPHWCKWQHCRAVSHRCCLSGVRGQSDRVIKLELVTAAGWTGRNCELAGASVPGLEWSGASVRCSAHDCENPEPVCETVSRSAPPRTAAPPGPHQAARACSCSPPATN